MKKINLFLVTSIFALGLFSCGEPSNESSEPNDGRSRELAPVGEKAVDTVDGINKLSKAVENMSNGDNGFSAKLDASSSLLIDGTTKTDYEDDPTKNETVTYNVSITNPLFDIRGVGLSGSDANKAKASLFLGGDFKGTLSRNGVGKENNINSTDAVLGVYVNDNALYLDATKSKNLVKQIASAYLGKDDYSMLIEGLLREKYKFADTIVDDKMPLLPSSFASEIDNYLSLFSENAEEYKDFLNVSEKDGNYSFYLTLTKEDLVRILSDSQDKYADTSDASYEPVDFASELKNSTVNALELLITFNETALISADFNIDMNVIQSSEITSSEINGVEDTRSHFIGKGKIGFGTLAPAEPVSSEYKDGNEIIKALEPILKSSGIDISDIIGSIIK